MTCTVSRQVAALCVVIVCGVSGCSRSGGVSDPAEAAASGIVTVYAVNYPLQYFAERIGGKHVEAVLPVPGNQDPAYWMPPHDVISEFQQADLILLNGASYERWTRTVSLPQSRLVNTTKLVRDQFVKIEGEVTHTHGPGGEHSHYGTAITTWLDPTLALAQADAVRAALVRLRPAHAGDFETGFVELKQDLQLLDAELARVTAGRNELPVFFSHPVFQYLIRRYQLNAESVDWEPLELPPDASWRELAKLRSGHPARWMIWEREPAAEITARLEQSGIKSAIFDPCGNAPPNLDYLDMMKRNIAELARVFE